MVRREGGAPVVRWWTYGKVVAAKPRSAQSANGAPTAPLCLHQDLQDAGMGRMDGRATVSLRSGGAAISRYRLPGILDKRKSGVIRYPASIWPGGFFAEACLQTHQVW